MKIGRVQYNDTHMTDANSLSMALMTAPEKLTPVITHLGGQQSKEFPLTALTEGVGNTKSINGFEYEYEIQPPVKYNRQIAVSNTTESGISHSIVNLTFPDRFFAKDYTLIGPSGVQVRIMGQPVPSGSDWTYPVQVMNPDPGATIPLADRTAGAVWACLFAAVGTDFSRGNSSNWATRMKVRHRIGTIRKSYQFSGNAKDWVMEVELELEGGRRTKLWMDYEEWRHRLEWKKERELFLWYGEQTYNEAGKNQMLDENNQPVQVGPGLFQQIINKDTYSELTANKLMNVVGDLFYGMTDGENRSITLWTGTGGAREFDAAMKSQIGSQNYSVYNDGKFVTGSGRNLTVTGFFTRYEHVDGHTVRVAKVPAFDYGPVAQVRPKHPKTGYSLESYRMVFVDTSSYEGEPNLTFVTKKNREELRWAVAGSVVPKGYGSDANLLRATDIDGASVHFLTTGGICLRRYDTSLDMQCVAS